jgi:Armadillo/beta-catenin-like repeat
MTTDARSIAQIRECGGVDILVKLLRAPKADTCAVAAGAVHNISREVIAVIDCYADCPFCEV